MGIQDTSVELTEVDGTETVTVLVNRDGEVTLTASTTAAIVVNLNELLEVVA